MTNSARDRANRNARYFASKLTPLLPPTSLPFTPESTRRIVAAQLGGSHAECNWAFAAELLNRALRWLEPRKQQTHTGRLDRYEPYSYAAEQW